MELWSDAVDGDQIIDCGVRTLQRLGRQKQSLQGIGGRRHGFCVDFWGIHF